MTTEQLDKINIYGYWWCKSRCLWCEVTNNNLIFFWIISNIFIVFCCKNCCIKQYKNSSIEKLSTKDLFYLRLTRKEFS
jgi:hypothetical protein